MDDSEIAMRLGEISGILSGMGREIGDLKTLVSDNNKNCRDSKTGFNSRMCELEMNGSNLTRQNTEDIVEIKSDLQSIKAFISNCTAIRSWIDTWYGKLATLIIAICAIAGLILRTKGA